MTMAGSIKKVLLIEDSESDAFMFKRIMRDHPCAQSYTVVCFDTIERAKSHLSFNPTDFDVVLLDLHLPDTTDGHDTLVQARSFLGDVPIVALTWCDSKEIARTLLAAGIEDYICKSYVLTNPDLLCRSIDFAVSRNRQAQLELSRLMAELGGKHHLLSDMISSE